MLIFGAYFEGTAYRITDVLDIKCEGKRRMINYKKITSFCTLVYKFFKGKEAATFLSNHFSSRFAVGT